MGNFVDINGVVAAFKSGQLRHEDWIVMVDNDSCHLVGLRDDTVEPVIDLPNAEGWSLLSRLKKEGVPCESV